MLRYLEVVWREGVCIMLVEDYVGRATVRCSRAEWWNVALVRGPTGRLYQAWSAQQFHDTASMVGIAYRIRG